LDKMVKGGKRCKAQIKKQIFKETNLIIKKGDFVDRHVKNRVVMKKVKLVFRKKVGKLLYKSKLLKHGYNKPAGYPGDHNIIEHIYANRPISKGLGKYLDMYALRDNYANAVKLRKNKMKEIMYKYIKNNRPNIINILNLGAGSCREVREVLKTLKTEKTINFTFIDQDKNALDYSKSKLAQYSHQHNFIYIRANLISLCRDKEKFSKILGAYDMIYSIGLADYIPDYYLEKLISFSFSILKKNGQLIIAHKDVVTYNSLMSDWFCDWNFIPRDENSLICLFKNSLNSKKYKRKQERVKGDKVIFVYIVKKG
ncbi:class I SAM-dependent methyltransferase, partial [Omnitrophica bacterium]|nr:class I SAM-dependent methyltransferase [Candidatus Omnitrophota bacterium]